MRWLMPCALLVCLIGDAPAAPPAEARARLDAAVEAHWKGEAVTPAAPADDAAFCRRAWLDLAGRVPPALRAQEFLAATGPDKRARLVDTLLASDDFAEHWGRAWAQRLTGKRPVLDGTYDGRVLAEYLRDALKANRPYRQVVAELIAGDGLNDSSGPANFLLRYECKPTDLAGAVSKHFLGVTLQCAQCHDHPHAHWKKEDFWGVAAFFGRLRLLQGDNLAGVFEARRGELQVPDTAAKPAEDGSVPMKVVPPRLPVEKAPAVKGKRRQALADWVTADDNPYFARHAVNQAWAQLFGAPLLGALDRKPGDEQRLATELVGLLAEDFKASGYDLKRLLRAIALSRPYQLSTGGGDETASADTAKEEARHRQVQALARFRARPLSVDQLYQSIAQATGHRGAPDPPAPAEGAEEETSPDDAAQDADPGVREPAEGAEEETSPDVAVTALGERGLTVQRALALLNGEYLNKAAEAGAKSALAVNGQRPAAAHVEWLFLTTLSRRPTAEESAAMLAVVKQGGKTHGLEDVLWALLNSAEFTTNH